MPGPSPPESLCSETPETNSIALAAAAASISAGKSSNHAKNRFCASCSGTVEFALSDWLTKPRESHNGNRISWAGPHDGFKGSLLRLVLKLSLNISISRGRHRPCYLRYKLQEHCTASPHPAKPTIVKEHTVSGCLSMKFTNINSLLIGVHSRLCLLRRACATFQVFRQHHRL